MLKCVRVILLCLVVVCSLAYVPRTYAASADLMLVQIQAGGTGAATQELIVLYNNSPASVNITHYCLVNKNNSEIACFETMSPEYARYLLGYSYAVVASSAYEVASGLPISSFTIVYDPINQSSGSLTGSSDHIKLVNGAGEIIDRHAWTTSLTGGMSLIRETAADYPTQYTDTDATSDWSVQASGAIPADQTIMTSTQPPDFCPNLEGTQITIPDHLYLDEWGECREYEPEQPLALPLHITELLPNASGSDAGQEFIELYNPNDATIELGTYTLQIGPSFEHSYLLPDILMPAKTYHVLSNADIGFTLLNTSSRARLVAASQAVVSETPVYQNPKDGVAWALVADSWQYTLPTPGEPNRVTPIAPEKQTSANSTSLKPCAANQYRNPETNRCRLIASTASTLTPCASHQVRNPATNRCRTAVQEAGLTPCKEGQERNPETNRCRTVKDIPEADYGVLGAETKQEESAWYLWIVVGLTVVAALIYAAWEWRTEIGRMAVRVRQIVKRR